MCINEYDFDFDSAKKDLNLVIFNSANEKWLDFICTNRSGKYIDGYDIVIGPAADDKIYRVVVEYENEI